VGSTNWSARFTREYLPIRNGQPLRFAIDAVGGYRITVDGALVLDAWDGQASGRRVQSYTPTRTGTAPLVIEYWEGGSGSRLREAHWSCAFNSQPALVPPQRPQHATNPFSATLTTALCGNYQELKILVDGQVAATCDAWINSCTYNNPNGFAEGRAQVSLTGVVSMVSGPPATVTTNYVFATCTDGVRNGDEVETDVGGSCPERVLTLTGSPNFSSNTLLAEVDTFLDMRATAYVTNRATGAQPHKINYSWRLFAGHDTALVRLHLKKFNMGTATLVVERGDQGDSQTLTGTGPADGYTKWFTGGLVRWTLNTGARGVLFPRDPGFEIDFLEVKRLKSAGVLTAIDLEETNREWIGAMASGETHVFQIEIPANSADDAGGIDVYTQASGLTLETHLVRGTDLTPFLAQISNGRPITGTSIVASNTGPAAANGSRIINRKLPAGTYSVIVRATPGGRGTYTLMVNRVARVYRDVEVEMDWAEGDKDWSMRLCQMKALLGLAAERLYAATDGFIRFESFVYREATWYDATDIYFLNEDVRARAWDLLVASWIRMGKNHLNFFTECGSTTNDGMDKNGAATLVHEWGHYEIGLGDEYRDLLDASGQLPSFSLCPYSLMANSGRREFCSQMNHNPNNGASFTIQDEDSTWKSIREYLDDGIPAGVLDRTPNQHQFDNSAVRSLVQIKKED
jgi:hypothetical protein